ncbi:rhodanese-like domain-containing protein [Deinococcus deserti]|uniref:Putative rhodanese sulfurtransferase n=1 Tax=Deinococcus deserti (strain DSM 17065 / CIP 109153 / LMG 22923 / VCD115) TaxID=546414 RepID=C1CV12_DEIDV|nr:rhodanese-like domain-containing protein [Deinococcus deserti]ACO46029.1 putative rhodanese sulfurtransferase [Deinococcus deserti VCD115]
MPLPEPVTVVDLRPEDLRRAQPLDGLGLRVVAISLQAIEDSQHGLTRDQGALLVVCERGVRSSLAARYLRAEGLDAQAQPGGIDALLLALRP